MSSATDSAPAISPSPHCWGPHKASQRVVVKALQISKVHTREPSSPCSWLSRESDSMAFGHKEKGQDGASTSNLTSYLSSKTSHLAYLWAWSPLCPRGTEKNSVSEQFLVLLGPSVLNLQTFLTLSGASRPPACLPAGPPLSSPVSAADGRIHSPHGGCQHLPREREIRWTLTHCPSWLWFTLDASRSGTAG